MRVSIAELLQAEKLSRICNAKLGSEGPAKQAPCQEPTCGPYSELLPVCNPLPAVIDKTWQNPFRPPIHECAIGICRSSQGPNVGYSTYSSLPNHAVLLIESYEHEGPVRCNVVA